MRWPDWIEVAAGGLAVRGAGDPRSDDGRPGPVAQRPAEDPAVAVRSVRLLVGSLAELGRARAWLRALGAGWADWTDADGQRRRVRVVGGGESLAWRPAGDGWEASAELEGWL